jgi:hypothetical protein
VIRGRHHAALAVAALVAGSRAVTVCGEDEETTVTETVPATTGQTQTDRTGTDPTQTDRTESRR